MIMRKTFTLSIFSLGLVLVMMSMRTSTGPNIKWKDELHDFAKIKQGVIGEFTFEYTNTGDEALEIREVRPACGCTTPTWSREPIAPGQTGYLKVKFNSSNYLGPFYRTIAIVTNVPNEVYTIAVRGEVEKLPSSLEGDPNKSPVLKSR